MPHIHIFLQELDTLYHTGDFDLYEQSYQQACHHAELYSSGSDRIPDGSMRHVLVPKPQGI